MKRLRDIAVGYKLAIILAVTTITALLLISAAFICFDYFSSRTIALDELHGVARMLAGNSAAAVAFNDARSAYEVLSTLQPESEIRTACTYDASGTLLAEFHRSWDAQCPRTMPSTAMLTFAGAGAVCRQPILLHDEPAGYIYLESNLGKLRHRRSRFMVISAVFLCFSLGLALLVGSKLNRWIAAPIKELASIMQEVSSSRNYALRGIPRGQDEIGALVEGFNQMLGEIQSSHVRLKSQAMTDDLTGLPNRRLLNDRLSHEIAGAARHKQQLAVIYLDLDGFKLVNDTLGHSMGDLLLRQVADRLQSRVRASDTLARIGGDEFTVVAGQIREAHDAELVAKDLLSQLARPFLIDGHELTLTASMGISLFPSDSRTAEELIQHADTAMYVAKSTGKNCFKWFTPEFGDLVRERLELENQLRGAVERGELTIDYQPEFDLVDLRLVRFEALARWRHPTLGLISPVKFIPIAEETGLISEIGMWVMEQACAEAKRWQEIHGEPVEVAVNVSTIQFFRDDFNDSVAGVLARTGLDPKLLQLELTESVFMPSAGDSAAKMAQLQALGVGMAVDDFGTGYSTLSYLPRLPFDSLKIDRSFLSQISHSNDSRALVQSLVRLAHELNRMVIAEGVETVEQLKLMQQIGCDQVQGFLLGHPTAEPDQYLAGNRPASLAEVAQAKLCPDPKPAG